MDMPKSRFEPDVDSVKGLAHALGVSPSTVYSWFKNGDVVAHENNGKLIVIDEESVDFMLNKLRERRRHPPKTWASKALEKYREWQPVVEFLCSVLHGLL